MNEDGWKCRGWEEKRRERQYTDTDLIRRVNDLDIDRRSESERKECTKGQQEIKDVHGLNRQRQYSVAM